MEIQVAIKMDSKEEEELKVDVLPATNPNKGAAAAQVLPDSNVPKHQQTKP